MIILFISIGVFQDYIIYNIKQCLLLGYDKIYVLTESKNFEKLKEVFDKIKLVNIDNVKTIFDVKSKLNKNFRNGFFHNCSKRFFILYEYLKTNTDEYPILHIENDVLLYKKFNSNDFEKDKINLIMDNINRCIPGLIYIPNKFLLEKIINNYKYNHNDMVNLALFYNNNKKLCVSLPIINSNTKYNTKTIYNETYNKYKSIFDGAAIGQYLGGVDPRNINGDTKGFVNETCEIKYNHFKFQLTKNGNNLFPNIIIDDKLIPINNLHIHSKNLKSFMINNFNENKFISKNIDIITGEKIQFISDIFLGNLDDFKFNPNVMKYHKNKCINIKSIKHKINNNNKIFCYTHLLNNIDELIEKLNYMKNKFKLIFHNSDSVLLDEHVSKLLTIDNIEIIYSQNCDVIKKYNKPIIPLPIGIGNSQWKHGNLDIIREIYYKDIKKNNNIYFNFNVKTNLNKRQLCYDIILKKGIKWNTNKQYKEYLQELKSYKYAICPEGNGTDTHRFWECLYMDVIPICIKNKLVDYYSKYFPIIILDKWEDLNIESLISDYKNKNKINHYYLDMKTIFNFN